MTQLSNDIRGDNDAATQRHTENSRGDNDTATQ